MNRIRLLPEHVANQIAAGEVVERPASVVKELVENALDAKSTRVTVEIQAGGRSLVRVTDDGVGMSRDDALLCLERHATSKIGRAEDLAAITTMGFRGEALPSIASVSRFTLTTRERDSESPEGTRVVVQGGKIVEVKAAGSPTGTTVEVRQIFFNLPARRKFLRSEETERAHIQHYLTVAALANPETGFTFIDQQRVVWQLPPVSVDAGDPDARAAALRERLRALHGAELKLVGVEYSVALEPVADMLADAAEENDAPAAAPVRIWGFIGAPGVSRATREDQHLFVNRRPVENRGLNFALLEGYHTALMKGRFPVCCLFVEIDPAEVDVNIHPAKREVKFRHEGAVRRIVAQAVREALLKFHDAPAVAPSVTPPLVARTTPVVPAPNASRHLELPLPNRPVADWPSHPLPNPASPPSAPKRAEAEPRIETVPLPLTPAIVSLPGRSEAASSQGATTGPVPLLRVPLRLVGVIGKLYVVLESDRGLVLLDQHAAHERILYEQMLKRLEHGDAPSQRLLLPETVELSPRDAHFLRELLPSLTRLGVGLSEFGEHTFMLDALPPFVKTADARRFALELVDELRAAGDTVNTLRLGEHTVAKTVCRHAVKANDFLSGRELENLVEDLRRCEMPYTCPHGRPTLIEMSYRELEKKFGRSQ
ncbi:MAG TPA: DNA mismatch repair endonuclease MutL [Verrucomicrobiae bacterium]|nr:DNA mismatch repair endonuclease MutL [Verrucomicrobiae bacterium]